MKRMMLVLGLLVCVLTLGGNSSTKSVLAQGEQTSLQGHVFGAITISQEVMSELSDDQKYMRFGKEGTVDFENGDREVKVGIEGVVVSIGRKKATTDEEGRFYLTGLRPGRKYVMVMFGKEKFLQQLVFLEEGEENYQDFVVVKRLSDLAKSMGGTKAQRKHGGVHCLKTNFLCFNPVGSDCYKNLMRGNTYCWRELLNLQGDKWCNDTRNCSGFIGHKQEWHCDWTP